MNLTDLLDEIGFWTIVQSPRDIRLVFISKLLRSFSYGGVNFMLALYLKTVGFDPSSIGIFISVGMLGDLLKTSYLGFYMDHYGRQKMMFRCYLGMMATNFVFLLTTYKPALWVAVFCGIFSVGGLEISIFRPCEQTIIAQLGQISARSDYFTWYALTGNLLTALGSGFNGALIWALQNKFQWSDLQAYKSVFFVMILLTLLMLATCRQYSQEIELVKEEIERPKTADSEFEIDEPKPTTTFQLMQSPRFVRILQVVILYFIDALCKSIVIDSWIAYYIVQRFQTDTKTVGNIFLFTRCVSAVMSLVGNVCCKRYGPIKTMLFTHFPCSVFVCLIPFAPNLWVMLIFLVFRSTFSSMDMGSKFVFLSAITENHERSAALALQNSLRTFGQVIAPIATGIMTNHDSQWLSFVISAVARVIFYEGGILLLFWKDRHSIGL
ncbi:hypothetical protein OGAPHI_000246 [Ogataea philodendri]|uniref:Major facilitator superfamily (MFS) profile domain-containing protein n=1 Tax=Ogataea philodendri TaxID=1378263 RepID=A0A9P8PFZ3_9ASCO|nr:uncharacterized protein OGAPHI_000246 [Ogataea philodendri]KAH3671543.1 hypothetical protein OGAPHI_000246 [Ogataea philodendri]